MSNKISLNSEYAGRSIHSDDTDTDDFEQEPLLYLAQHGYHRIKELGKSLYGKVYYAEHRWTKERVAVKASRTSLLNTKWESPHLEYDLVRLAHQTAPGTHSPNIIHIKGFHQKKNWCYTLIEYCEQGDLFDYVARKTRLSEEEVRSLLRQLFRALAHLHSQGIYHLDVSLENMFLTSDGALKLADFGCARQWQAGALARFRNFRPGKWGYMSPEVFGRGMVDGELADVWSCGVGLFIMLSGRAPYRVPKLEDRHFTRVFVHRNFSDLHFSPEAEDFLSRILCPTQLRWRIAELLQHPFMNSTFSAVSAPSPSRSPFVDFLQNTQAFQDNTATSCNVSPSALDISSSLCVSSHGSNDSFELSPLPTPHRSLSPGILSGRKSPNSAWPPNSKASFKTLDLIAEGEVLQNETKVTCNLHDRQNHGSFALFNSTVNNLQVSEQDTELSIEQTDYCTAAIAAWPQLCDRLPILSSSSV
eukprot:gb/GEZN01006354.1/.p1 GENE.gb/GEZN01006354.1/~~gb/GEZN01006354.1/.p1  ORF type:complete len:474 (-),score=16.61 gb/GEZN01006354.1/:25-1446(-)